MAAPVPPPTISPFVQSLLREWDNHLGDENLNYYKRTYKAKYDEQLMDAAKAGKPVVIFPFGNFGRASIEMQAAEIAFGEWVKERQLADYIEAVQRFHKRDTFEGNHNEIAWRSFRVNLSALCSDARNALKPVPAVLATSLAPPSKPAAKVEEIV
jgi:hypothetical protein